MKRTEHHKISIRDIYLYINLLYKMDRWKDKIYFLTKRTFFFHQKINLNSIRFG